MLYVIENEYVGANPDSHLDDHVITVQTRPTRYNMSREVCLDGWAGTTNDYCETAHGGYETIEEARAAIAELFGECRDVEWSDPDYAYRGVVEEYRVGKYAKMSYREVEEWLYGDDVGDVTADTTDDELTSLAAEYGDVFNEIGGTADLEIILEIITERRDDLRERRDDA